MLKSIDTFVCCLATQTMFVKILGPELMLFNSQKSLKLQKPDN